MCIISSCCTASANRRAGVQLTQKKKHTPIARPAPVCDRYRRKNGTNRARNAAALSTGAGRPGHDMTTAVGHQVGIAFLGPSRLCHESWSRLGRGRGAVGYC